MVPREVGGPLSAFWSAVAFMMIASLLLCCCSSLVGTAQHHHSLFPLAPITLASAQSGGSGSSGTFAPYSIRYIGTATPSAASTAIKVGPSEDALASAASTNPLVQAAKADLAAAIAAQAFERNRSSVVTSAPTTSSSTMVPPTNGTQGNVTSLPSTATATTTARLTTPTTTATTRAPTKTPPPTGPLPDGPIVVAFRRRLSQAVLTAQEAALPPWARWKSFRHPINTSLTDGANSGKGVLLEGSFMDLKTSGEDDSGDSLTWLNEFFHPSASVGRNRLVGAVGTTTAAASGSSEGVGGGLVGSGYARRPVAYFDYDPLSGAPFTGSTIDYNGMVAVHGPNRTLIPMSTLDARPERQFYRRAGGGCRFSVPFFSEPLLPMDEGVQFFVSANGNLLTTSYPPCYYFCNDYKEATWPGVYLINDDLNPAAADRTIPPLVVGRDPNAFLPLCHVINATMPSLYGRAPCLANATTSSSSNTTTTTTTPQGGGGGGGAAVELPMDAMMRGNRSTLHGFSGVWIDRYVYADGNTDAGVRGEEAGTEGEGVSGATRAVSVVLTYENIPTFGIVSEANFTAQVELFTNGTLIMRYRTMPPPSNHFGKLRTTFNPSIMLTRLQSISANLLDLPVDHPLYSLDRYNATDISLMSVVAMRFDLGMLGSHRAAAAGGSAAAAAAAVEASRCLVLPTMQADDVAVIPAGRRDVGTLNKCAAQSGCNACLAASASNAGGCVWCGGMRAASPGLAASVAGMSVSEGLCMPLAYAGDYCPPSAQYAASGGGACTSSVQVVASAFEGREFPQPWSLYNMTTMGTSTIANLSSLGQTWNLVTTAQSVGIAGAGAASGTLRYPRSMAVRTQEELLAASLAWSVRSGQGASPAPFGRNNALPAVPSPSYFDLAGEMDKNGVRYLRRATNAQVGAALQETMGALTRLTVTSRTVDCLSVSGGSYYGDNTLQSTLEVAPLVTSANAMPFFRSSAEARFTMRGLSGDPFIGLEGLSGAVASIKAHPTRAVPSQSNPQHQLCMQRATSRLPASNASPAVSPSTLYDRIAFVSKGLVTDDYPLMNYPAEWVTLVAQTDLFYSISPSGGTVSVGCLATTAPTRAFYSRMASGTDDGNVWYLREAQPPLSSLVTLNDAKPSVSVLQQVGGSMVTVGMALPTLMRPGRVATVQLYAMCPVRCGYGACDNRAGVCVCSGGSVGESCDACPVGYHRPVPESVCIECDPCNSTGGFCHGTSGRCVCNVGYFGDKCSLRCPNGAQTANIAANGLTTCDDASCPRLRGTCRCAECACNEGYEGPLCLAPSSTASFPPEAGYFIAALACAVPILVVILYTLKVLMPRRGITFQYLREKLIGTRWRAAASGGAGGAGGASRSMDDQQELPLLLLPEISGPVSSAPREMWDALRDGGPFPTGGSSSLLARHQQRPIPCVSEPDVYEPPALYVDEADVDYL